MSWLTASWPTVYDTVLSGVFILLAITALVRVVGLRALAKMNSVDFLVTVASGAILGSTVVSDTTSVGQGVVAIATLMAIQVLFTFLRRQPIVARVLDNEPILLMARTRVLHDNLRASRRRARLRPPRPHQHDRVTNRAVGCACDRHVQGVARCAAVADRSSCRASASLLVTGHTSAPTSCSPTTPIVIIHGHPVGSPRCSSATAVIQDPGTGNHRG